MHPKDGWDALQRETRGEGGDHRPPGRACRDTLDALAAFEKEAKLPSGGNRRPPRRRRLVDAAACSLWTFTVQRDLPGLGWMTKKHVLEGLRRAARGARKNGRSSCPLRDN